jgi:hypothetical protein
MKFMRLIGPATLAVVVSAALIGSAAADSVSMDTTGPNSTQKVSVDNSSTISTTNTNNVQTDNINAQDAATGSVTAKDNTTVTAGPSSGDAANNNLSNTTITINNPSAGGLGAGTVEPGSGSMSVGSTSPGNGAAAEPGKGGEVLGASTPGLGAGSPEILPVTGPEVPVDVSAIRAAWHLPSTDTAASNVVKGAQPVTAAMLATAALLSLIGAAASVLYTRRRERSA